MKEQTNIPDLGPIYEPDPVGFGFDTIGWKMLAVLTLVTIIWISIILIKHYLKNAYRREALRLMQTIESSYGQNPGAQYVQDAFILIKQVALHSFAREEVANLYGAAWLDYLDSKAKNVQLKRFDSLLSAALYKDEVSAVEEGKQFLVETKKWIVKHAA